MRIKQENLTNELLKKKTKYKIRVTTQLSGTNKNKFLQDCINKQYPEVKMASHIIDVYYFMQDNLHNFEKIEPNKIKDFITNRIKL
jgi:hypothetical protein